eukprot:1139377-Pelagomonas_calceolata.AAC.6
MVHAIPMGAIGERSIHARAFPEAPVTFACSPLHACIWKVLRHPPAWILSHPALLHPSLTGAHATPASFFQASLARPARPSHHRGVSWPWLPPRPPRFPRQIQQVAEGKGLT